MSAAKPLPAIELIRELLTYDPGTGRMHWARDYFKMRKGAEAGCITDTGYWVIKIAGSRYRRNRLAWAHFHGKPPEQEIDHIDRWKKNDRIANLRDVSKDENMANRGEPIGPDPDPDVFVGMMPIARAPREKPEPKPKAAPRVPKPKPQAKKRTRNPARRIHRLNPNRKPKAGGALPKGIYQRTRANGTTRWVVGITVDGTRYRSEGYRTPAEAQAMLNILKNINQQGP